MKIAIIGYGKMGHLIAEIAKKRGHEISCIIDLDDKHLFNSEKFRNSDVAIEFTVPDAAVEGIMECFAAKVPVVVGTTGWSDSLPAIREMCEKGKGTLFFSSNFSIGMNIFMAINRYLGKIMNEYENYSPSLKEVHHIHKLDHPSGTAITLAEDLVKVYDKIKEWFEPEEGHKLKKEQLPIYHERLGEVPGIHTVTWESDCDEISITHSAKNRNGFALGAVCAAEWLKGKKGFFTMQDMLNFD